MRSAVRDVPSGLAICIGIATANVRVDDGAHDAYRVHADASAAAGHADGNECGNPQTGLKRYARAYDGRRAREDGHEPSVRGHAHARGAR